MFLHFHRGRKRGKREIVKPCFFVLRRRTLTFGAALLMAVAIFGAVNAPAAVRASAATRQLPIYCVERDQKVCSISFDAAWGADNTQRILAAPVFIAHAVVILTGIFSFSTGVR